MKSVVTLILLCCLSLSANEGIELAKEYGLIAGTKVKRQWNRVFSKEIKMKKLGIFILPEKQKKALKEYLINHAADSDQPEKAGS